MSDVRLRLDFDTGLTLWLDSMGCVRNKAVDYFLYPSAFLALFKRLEEVRLRQEKKRRPLSSES